MQVPAPLLEKGSSKTCRPQDPVAGKEPLPRGLTSPDPVGQRYLNGLTFQLIEKL